MSLIAKVLVVAWVDGKRTEFQPGEEIPDGVLSAHDLRELKAMGSIEDTADSQRAAKSAAAAEKAAGKEFEAARKRVKEAQASVQTPETPPAA